MTKQQRLPSLDFLKGCGIIYLIFLHNIVWMYIRGDFGGVVFPEGRRIVYAFGYRSGLHVLGLSIPLFAGMTYYFYVRRKRFGWPQVLQRAGGLAGLGFVMNLLAWGPGSFFDWDVLQFLALAMTVSYAFLRYVPERWGLSGVALLGLLSLAGSQLPLKQPEHLSYLESVLWGDPQGSFYWPFFPWFLLFAAGIVHGRVFFCQQHRVIAVFAATGAVLLLASLLTGTYFPVADFTNVWGPSLFKPNVGFLAGILGFAWLATGGLYLGGQRFPQFREHLRASPVQPFGYGILWIYLVSTVVGYHLTVTVAHGMFHVNFPQSVFALTVNIGIQLGGGCLLGRWVRQRKRKV